MASVPNLGPLIDLHKQYYSDCVTPGENPPLPNASVSSEATTEPNFSPDRAEIIAVESRSISPRTIKTLVERSSPHLNIYSPSLGETGIPFPEQIVKRYIITYASRIRADDELKNLSSSLSKDDRILAHSQILGSIEKSLFTQAFAELTERDDLDKILKLKGAPVDDAYYQRLCNNFDGFDRQCIEELPSSSDSSSSPTSSSFDSSSSTASSSSSSSSSSTISSSSTTSVLHLRLSSDIICSPNNVVLVDIFARENGLSKEDVLDGNKPAIHTICLWKVGEKKARLIDPSNILITRHLKEYLEKEFSGWSIELETFGLQIPKNPKNNPITFYAPPKDLRIPPGREDGSSRRDCIDIAVKIAFVLNEAQQSCLNEEMIQKSIRSLSNQRAINKVGGANEGTQIRGLQSSHAAIRNGILNIFRSNQCVIEHVKIGSFKDFLPIVTDTKYPEKIMKALNLLAPSPQRKFRIDELHKLDELRTQQRLDEINKELEKQGYQLNLVKIPPPIENDQISILPYFVNPSYQIALCDDSGQTPLHIAVRKGDYGTCKSLYENMSPDDIKRTATYRQQTALHLAVQANHEEIVSLLLSREDVRSELFRVRDALNGWLALHFAAEADNSAMVGVLINNITDQTLIGIPDDLGQTPLHLAASKGDKSTCRLLLNKMEQEDIRSTTLDNQYTALHLAVHSGHNNIIQLLIKTDPGLTAITDIHNQTPLYWAASNGNLEACQYLYSAMANKCPDAINERATDRQQTVLHLAVRGGSNALIRLLLSNDNIASNLINIPDHHCTAMELANDRIISPEIMDRMKQVSETAKEFIT